MLTLQGAVLCLFGQPIISRSGHVYLWWGKVLDKENSQHLTDWYTFSHIIHGIAFYSFFKFLFPKRSMHLRFVMAMALEIIWEIFENTPMVIDRYRQSALASGYAGDSVINSLSDTLAMSLGFCLAKSLPVAVTVTYILFTELLCAYEIHDNLTLNIIQLIHPFDSISRWQTDI